MANTAVCPQCKKELRSALPFAAGQTMRCPACDAVFVVSGAEVTANNTSASVVKSLPAARSDAFADDLDDLQDRRPGSIAEAAISAPAPKRSRGTLGFLFMGSAALIVFGVTALIWPGFLVPVRPASQARTLLAFIPANSTIVGGAQIGLFRKQPKFQAKWNELHQQITQLPDFPADARELLNDADEVVVGSGADLESSAVFVASTERPYDAVKVKRIAKAGAAEQFLGQTIHPVDNLLPGRTGFLALPTDKIIVLGFMSRDEFVRLLIGAAKARLHDDLQEQVDHAHSGLVWVAARFDERIRQHLRQANDEFGPLAVGFVPELPSLVGLVQRGKGALVSVDLGDQNLKLSVGITCKDAGDAGQCATSLNKIWNNQAKVLLGFAKAFMPKSAKLVGEVEQTFVMEQRDNTVLATMQLNQDTLIELLDAVPKLGNPGQLPPGFKLGVDMGGPKGKILNE